MASEQEIFNELGRLCSSPGYIHTIAYFCFRDNIVRYNDEMTAKDMEPMFSPSRLIRTEISTLIGLIIKQAIDYALPPPAITQQYIDRTEKLLEELHRAVAEEMFSNVKAKIAGEKQTDPFSIGSVLREPIFYAGESAYCFQYRDLSKKKYEADKKWLEANKGFSIHTAAEVINALGALQTEKLSRVLQKFRHENPESWTILPGFMFSVEEVSNLSQIEKALVREVLVAFSLAENERNEKFNALNDFNIANAMPILRAPDEQFVLFSQYSIAEALYDSPFYWMRLDKAYVASAMEHRGRFTEELSAECLERVFGKNRVHTNIDIYKNKSERIGEIDILVLFGNRAIIVQSKL